MRSFHGSEWVRRSSGLDVQRLAVEVTARVCRLVGGVPPMLRSQQEQAVKAVAERSEPRDVVLPHPEVDSAGYR